MLHSHTPAAPRRRRVGRSLLLATLALSAIASVAVAPSATADEAGLYNSTSGALPDNWNHTYCFSGAGWTATWKGYVNTQMANLDTQTNYYDTSKACDSITDISFQLSSSISARGDYTCLSWNLGNDNTANTGDEECEASRIRINSSSSVLPDAHQRKKTICHEIGHSVGLAHGTNTATYWNDCMKSGTVAAGTQWEKYNAHHVSHANAHAKATS